MPLKVRSVGKEAQGHIDYLPRDKIVLRWSEHANRDVRVALQQVCDLVADLDLDLNHRVLGHELGNQSRQQKRAEYLIRGHSDCALNPLFQTGGHPLEVSCRSKHLFRGCHEIRSFVCQAHAFAPTRKELEAQLVFQKIDVAPDSWLSQA
jgi:hypothetical protein